MRKIMELYKVKLNERKIEADYHIHWHHIIRSTSGDYQYIEFDFERSLEDIPNAMLTKKNVIMVYNDRNDNIMYKGFVRKI